MDAIRRDSIKARRAAAEHDTARFSLAYAQAAKAVRFFWVSGAGGHEMIVYVDGRRERAHLHEERRQE